MTTHPRQPGRPHHEPAPPDQPAHAPAPTSGQAIRSSFDTHRVVTDSPNLELADPTLPTPLQHARALVTDRIAAAPTTADAVAIREAFDRHGIPFALYLALTADETAVNAAEGPAQRDLEGDFTDAYVGRYATTAELERDVIDTFGWADELHRALADYPMLRSVVGFSGTRIMQFVEDHFDVAILSGGEGGGIYLFEKRHP